MRISSFMAADSTASLRVKGFSPSTLAWRMRSSSTLPLMAPTCATAPRR